MFFSRSTVKIEQDSSSNKDNLIHIEGLTDRTPNNTPVNFEEYQEMMNDNCVILQDTKFIFKDTQEGEVIIDSVNPCRYNNDEEEEVVDEDADAEEDEEVVDEDAEDKEDAEYKDEEEEEEDTENTIYVISIDNQVRYYEKNLIDAKSKISKMIENYNNQSHNLYHTNLIHYKPKNTVDIIRNFDFWLFSVNYPIHTFNITRLHK